LFVTGNTAPARRQQYEQHRTGQLALDDEPTVIDLASLPFGPGELDQLEERLGVGELTAELNALGRSIIRETVYPGVWWLEHRNTEGDIVGRYIEITRAPEILMSQDADIGAGRAQLGDSLERTAPGNNNGADNEPRPN
jgi:hydrogenase-1 operon protein HyaF